MKKVSPEKRKEYGDLLTNAIFSSAKYEGKTDAGLEKMFAEEREEKQRRKRAAEKTGEPNGPPLRS
jgi:arginyl-tRNA synthetase